MAEADVYQHLVRDWGGRKGNDVRFHYYSPDEIVAALKEAGFRRVEVHRLGWSADSPYRIGPPSERIEKLGIHPFQVLAFRA